MVKDRRRVCVVAVDIKRSKQMRERGAAQETVRTMLRRLNHSYRTDKLADFMITLGDEFQGALWNPAKAYDVFLDLKQNLRLPFYCGLGLGGISTSISTRIVEMDGPAFHHAREALGSAKKLGKDLVIRTDSLELDRLINSLTALIVAVRNKRTRRQKTVVENLEARQVSRVDIARKMGVTKQAISKTLKSAAYNDIMEAEGVLRELLVNPTKFTMASKL